MKQCWNLNSLKLVLAVVVFLITFQIGYAQTASEYGSKIDQEKRKIIEDTFQKAFERLASDTDSKGAKVSENLLINRRRASNLIRALLKVDMGKSSKTEESIGFIRFKQYLDVAAEDAPEKSTWSIFLLYANAQIEEYYTKSNGEWKKDFDSKNDAEQQTKFRIEILNKLIADRLKTLDSNIATLEAKKKAENEALQKKIEANKAEIEKREENIKKIDNILRPQRITAIRDLKVTFRALKANPKSGSLFFNHITDISIKFDMECYIKNSKSKNLSVSISETGTVTFVKGKNGGFVVGERCEFYFDSENIRSYTISSK